MGRNIFVCFFSVHLICLRLNRGILSTMGITFIIWMMKIVCLILIWKWVCCVYLFIIVVFFFSYSFVIVSEWCLFMAILCVIHVLNVLLIDVFNITDFFFLMFSAGTDENVLTLAVTFLL